MYLLFYCTCYLPPLVLNMFVNTVLLNRLKNCVELSLLNYLVLFGQLRIHEVA